MKCSFSLLGFDKSENFLELHVERRTNVPRSRCDQSVEWNLWNFSHQMTHAHVPSTSTGSEANAIAQTMVSEEWLCYGLFTYAKSTEYHNLSLTTLWLCARAHDGLLYSLTRSRSQFVSLFPCYFCFHFFFSSFSAKTLDLCGWVRAMHSFFRTQRNDLFASDLSFESSFRLQCICSAQTNHN